MHNVEFIGVVAPTAPSGGLAASKCYVFRLDGKIKLTACAPAFLGRLSEDDVRRRASQEISRRLDDGYVFEDGESFEIRF